MALFRFLLHLLARCWRYSAAPAYSLGVASATDRPRGWRCDTLRVAGSVHYLTGQQECIARGEQEMNRDRA